MILYKTIISSTAYTGSLFVYPIIGFCTSFLGSLCIGVCTALMIAYLLKKHYSFGVEQKHMEILSMGLCPWVTYLLAEVS